MSGSSYKCVYLNPKDNIAVALEPIPAGARVSLRGYGKDESVEVAENIDFGHKFAVRPIPQGEAIRKYGEIIGKAVRDIRPGEHVHVHNLEGTRGRGDLVGGSK